MTFVRQVRLCWVCPSCLFIPDMEGSLKAGQLLRHHCHLFPCWCHNRGSKQDPLVGDCETDWWLHIEILILWEQPNLSNLSCIRRGSCSYREYWVGSLWFVKKMQILERQQSFLYSVLGICHVLNTTRVTLYNLRSLFLHNSHTYIKNKYCYFYPNLLW